MTTMTTMSPNRAGLVLGAVFGGCHLLWALLVAVGWAQPVMDFLFWIHMIKPVYVIEPFNLGLALLLIVVTAAIGYAMGWSFAVVWNRLHR